MAKRRARKPRSPAPRAGLPAKDSVRKIITKTAPTGMKFRILRTSEMDGYDRRPRGKKRRG